MKNWQAVLIMTIILVVFVVGGISIYSLKTDYVEKWDISVEGDESVYATLTYADGYSKNDHRPFYTLTVKGKGAMCDFTEETEDDGCNYSPWYNDYRNYILNLVVEGDVTSIGDYAFYYSEALENAKIGGKIEKVGKGAFFYCSGLTTVDIGQDVLSLSSNPFQNCANLKTVKVNSKNQNYCVENNVLLNKNKTVLETYPSGSELDSYVVPSTVTKISPYAFYNSANLKAVTLSTNLTVIEEFAFSASAIENITIPDSVISIDSHAFESCEALRTVNLGTGLKTIGNATFHSCIVLQSINLSNNIESIGDNAFFNCKKMTSAVIGDKLETIGAKAFSNCEKLKDVYILNTDVATGLSENTSSGLLCYYADNVYILSSIKDSSATLGNFLLSAFNTTSSTVDVGGVAYYKYTKNV